MTFRVRAQRYNNFRNYKNCHIFVSKILRLLLCTGTYPALMIIYRIFQSIGYNIIYMV